MANSASPRIPIELQKIFLASNAGETVHEPPKGLGFKVFKKVFRLASSKRQKQGPGIGKPSSLLDDKSSHTLDGTSHHLSPTANADVCNDYESPQTLIEAMLSERGYSTRKHKAVETSFRFKPTPFELASFNSYSLKCVEEDRNDAAIRSLLEAGISPNACNRDSELLLHKACRLGKHQHVRLFLEFGADLRVCSAFGRTALHDTCYGQRPSFQTFSVIVEKDPSLLFMMDCRGLCPLEYIRKEHFVFWFEYLERNVDKFWPMRRDQEPHTPLSLLGKPFTRTLSKPANALPPELAHMIASGKMTTKEISLLLDDTEMNSTSSTGRKIPCEEVSTACTDDESESSSCDSSTESNESFSDDSSSNFSDDELFVELGLR